MNELLFEIAKSLELSYYEYQELINDVLNMRGSEWWDDIDASCPSDLSKEFYNLINWSDN